MNEVEIETPPTTKSVPEQALAEARHLVKLRFLKCFWFWRPRWVEDEAGLQIHFGSNGGSWK